MFCLHFVAKSCLTLAHKLEIVNYRTFSLMLTSRVNCVSERRAQQTENPCYSPCNFTEWGTEDGLPGRLDTQVPCKDPLREESDCA